MTEKKGKTQHVVKRDNGWAVVNEDNNREVVRTTTQREAIKRAREIARNQGTEVVIHRRDGQIRSRNSYGNDPQPPQDWFPTQPKPIKNQIKPASPASTPPSRVIQSEQRDLSERIVASQDVLHGKPRIAGTRIMVYQILDLLAAGKKVDEITSEEYFPDITAEDVYAAIEYAAHNLRNNNTPA
jgi:uncharacterized protein (DUF433 family)